MSFGTKGVTNFAMVTHRRGINQSIAAGIRNNARGAAIGLAGARNALIRAQNAHPTGGTLLDQLRAKAKKPLYPVECEHLIDSYSRVLLAFKTNADDHEGKKIFVAEINGSMTVDNNTLQAFVSPCKPSDKGKLSRTFAAPANLTADNGKQYFIAYPNADYKGNHVFIAVANVSLDRNGNVLPSQQIPLDKDGSPLFIGFPQFKDKDGQVVFVGEPNHSDRDGKPIYVGPDTYDGIKGSEMYFFAPPNYTDPSGRELFVAYPNSKFDGRSAFVVRFNFIRSIGSNLLPSSPAFSVQSFGTNSIS